MGIDLLMMFSKNGQPVPAEARSDIDTDDDLMSGFSAGGFFEIEDFEFGLKLFDEEARSPSVPGGGKEQGGQRRESFSGWVRGLTPAGGAPGARLYPVSLDECSFSRKLDKASVRLLESCFGTESFDSAALVKRRLTGSAGAPISHVPYLRLDFASVLITSVEWDVNDDLVKEKVRFVCRGVRAMYRAQKPDGSLEHEISTRQLSLVQKKG